LGLGEAVDIGAVVAVADLGVGELGQVRALALQEGGHLLAGGQLNHLGAG